MRLLHVVPSIAPALGGLAETPRLMTASMSRLGVASEVLSVEAPCNAHREGWQVPVHGLGSVSYYQYSTKLVPWVRDNHTRFDAVIIHGIWRYPSVAVRSALAGTQKPYFLFVHGMLDPWFGRAYIWKHIKKTVFWRLFEHRALRDARSVLFTSEEELTLARTAFSPYRCAEHVVGMGTAPPPAAADEQLEAFHAVFPHTQRLRNILFLSRIHRKKGCDLLIRAFAKVAASHSRLHLVVAGPDEDGLRPELERLARNLRISDRITWTGPLHGAAKWGAFRAAEAFALPSHTENYGHAVVEAMACGVPVLISNKVNIWKDISADNAGIIGNDDLDGTCGPLSKWIALDESQRQAFGLNARRCFQTRFDIDAFSARLAKYLEIAISTPSQSFERAVRHG